MFALKDNGDHLITLRSLMKVWSAGVCVLMGWVCRKRAESQELFQ